MTTDYRQDRTGKICVLHKMQVKVKSLAVEATFIRHETARAGSVFVKNELYLHRVGELRHESRHAQLALAALRGRPYEQVERKCAVAPSWSKIATMIERMCPYWANDAHHKDCTDKWGVIAWIEAGRKYVADNATVVKTSIVFD